MSKKAVIVSAPSGAGKTTIVKHLLASIPQLGFSISACSRPIRKDEIDGKDYFFISADSFRQKVAHDEFVEWQEVYPGSYYGTLKTELDRMWKLGKTPIFDVDVQGGLNLKKYFGNHGLSIFIKPPSLEILIQRLRNRGSDPEESIQKRISKAESELGFSKQFDLVIVNDELDVACRHLAEKVRLFIS